jgi:uncharacterized membrane protein YcgQ (UPF0703/DUF1980 family)
MITGFIESGKTTLGLTVLENERFTNGGPALVLCCEEGETEWDEEKLKKHNGRLVMLDSAEELTTERLAQLDKEIQPTCVILEYNTMWGFEKLDQISLPRLWDWAQIVTTADATTFDNYMTNMRKILTDPMKVADMIVVNRCGPDFNKASWRKQLRAMNSGASIMFENLDGSVDDGITDEDLPYDMKADIIDISEEQFGLMYVDSMDHPERYDGKKVRIVGQAWKRREFPKGFYYFAREAMTCCSNDIAPCGWVCKGTRTPDNKTYFTLTALCRKVEGPEGETALMLEEISTERAKTPREELVNFVNL